MRHNVLMPLSRFSPAASQWFEGRYGQPTAVQASAWPAVASRQHVLISAATGSGKSLAAWLPLIDRLHQAPAASGVSVLYVSPLRALSRDMGSGILDCLDELETRAGADPARPPRLRLGIRTGDTSPGERSNQRRRPPDILLTTPESLFVMLGSEGGRRMLATVEAVIVDEIHALVDSKRGAHLALSLERLNQLTGRDIQRIGISATARPLRLVAGFLAGAGRQCRIVCPHNPRPAELRIELPDHPIGHLAGPAHWQFLSDRLSTLAGQGGSMLVFCNTRGLVERVAALLAERLEQGAVAAHHGSIGRERRQAVEAELKSGSIRVVVCSSSLELGIDVGPLDRVCQLGSPGAINSLMQRAGRSRHRPGETPVIHFFPLNLSDLLDGAALLKALSQGCLDHACVPGAAQDVLTQQLIAIVAGGQQDIESIFQIIRRAMPWRKFKRDALEQLIDMLHSGYVPGRETGHGPIFRRGQGQLGAAADSGRHSLLNAGTIPEWFEYDVLAPAQGRVLGKLDEEFAFESSPGQIMQLGGQCWRITRIVAGRVEVEPAETEAPDLPFWFGEGPGRSNGLSRQVAELCDQPGQGPLGPGHEQWLALLDDSRQLLGKLPGRKRIVLERFHDPSGDQHLVVHSLFGARLNRAWGLALRKRFCRGFNFELQAAATDNGLLISLGAVHSFDLEEVLRWLHSSSVAELLAQAVLDTPVFQTRMRWCASTAMAIRRRDFSGRVPAQVQRNQTENLIARIFPDQLACLENLSGEREIPDHPLVAQALKDCLEEFMDLPGLIRLLQGLEDGKVSAHAVDTARPSPLAEALIHAPRHSFLDPAAAEERRTRSFEDSRPRGRLNTASARSVGTDPQLACGGPEQKSALLPASADQLEPVLLAAGYLTAKEGEISAATKAFLALSKKREAISVKLAARRHLWCHVERLSEVLAIWPEARLSPFMGRGMRPEPLADAEEALCRLLLARVRWLGQVDAARLVQETGLSEIRIDAALMKLKIEGLLKQQQKENTSSWQQRRPAGVL